MTRDRRLLIPLGLMLVALVALAAQSIIVGHYIDSSIMDSNWESFVMIYGVEAPADGSSGVACLDYCAPRLPFVAGWLGISAFVGAIISIIYIWFKPRP